MPFKIPAFVTAKIVYLFALLVFVAILSLTIINIKTNGTPSESPPPAPQVDQAPKVAQETKNPKVETIVKSAQNLPGKYGIYIKDLQSQNTYELNSAQIFGAASIYKLAVLFKAYAAIESGQLKKNTLLSGEKMNPDQATPTHTETVSYSVQEALRLMITISDNNAA